MCVLLHEQCRRGVIVKALNCNIVIRDFELQPHYFIHFRTNTFGKGRNPLVLPSMVKI